MKLNNEIIESMKNHIAVCTVALVFLFPGSPCFAQRPDHVPDQLIIQLHYKGEVNEVLATINGGVSTSSKLSHIKQLSQRLNIHLIGFDPVMLEEKEALWAFRNNEEVFAAQLNHFVEQRGTIPNDPRFGDQWDMDNTGQSGGMLDADIDAPQAWDSATGGLTALGDTIVVAVIDCGFDLNHEDLAYWKNRKEIPNNNVDDDNNGYIDDYDGWNAYNSDGDVSSCGHGTHVAGTVGAIGNNGVGLAGVNWNVKIMPVQGSSGTESTVIESYGYVLELRATYNETNGDSGAFVVSTNSSFGSNFGDPVDFPIWCAFYDSLGVAGVLSAGATMNLDEDVDSENDIPTACPSEWMISVTNTTEDDLRNSGAAYGLTTIDLGAPGTDIWSTEPNDTYGQKTGTSMATPHVAGAVALLYAAVCSEFIADYKGNPGFYALQIRDYIFNGTDSIADLTEITVTDGRLNIYNSLMLLANCDYTKYVGMEWSVQPNDIRLYPNPTRSLLTIEGIEGDIVNVGLYNALGQEVPGVLKLSSKDKVELNLEAITPGFYIIRIQNTANIFSSRVVRY